MSDALLEAVRRYADGHADRYGVAATEVPGLSLVRSATPSDLQYSIQRPLACLVVQGSRYVTIGGQAFTFRAGDSLIITGGRADDEPGPEGQRHHPYYSLVLDLDPAVIADLTVEMRTAPSAVEFPVAHQVTDDEVADAALRLVRLLDRPASLSVLSAQLVREMHYWLLVGRHVAAIRRLGAPDGQMQRIARAVALLRENLARLIRVERLAAAAG